DPSVRPLQSCAQPLSSRTAMSESGAFEVSYNVFVEPRAPMFFAVWKHAPIKTTLLRELEEVCDVTYREFEYPEEFATTSIFRRIGRESMASAPCPVVARTRVTQQTAEQVDGWIARSPMAAPL